MAAPRRAVAGATGLLSAALLAVLALHHPLSPAAALAGSALVLALVAWRPGRWPLALLPLLPLGLMTWSGWIVVEEFDLAVLAVAAGGYLRMATGWPGPPGGGPPATRSPAKVALVMLPYAASVLLSLFVGVQDAGGWAFGWWQGYREPLNSLRLAKPLCEVLLLLPLWRAACRADAEAASRDLVWGLAGMLLFVSLVVVWERVAFTGLADFSTDYRATGPFWEMHIGGAALDAVLAMTVAAAVALLVQARSPLRWGLAAALLALGVYASLVTFSRIVYAAVPLAVVLFIGLRAAAAPQAGPVPGGRSWPAAVAWVAAFAALAAWSFPTSGYRGLAALLGVAALLLPLPGALALLRPLHLGLGLLLGALLASGAAVLAGFWGKGAYVAFALCFGIAAFALAVAQRPGVKAGRRSASPERLAAGLALAGFLGALAALVAVGVVWGGPKAALPSAGVAVVALILAVVAGLLGRRGQGLWPSAWRWHGQVAGLLFAAGATVAIFHGGAYMTQRMTSTAQDGEGRMEHWQRFTGLLQGADWAWGKGLGRFWARAADTGRPEDLTGDYRLLPRPEAGGGQAVVLTAGQHDLGSAQAFRLSQRLPADTRRAVLLTLDLRIEADVKIEVEACSRHLIYPGPCIVQQTVVKARPGQWQSLQIFLRKGELPAARWPLPALKTFSIALGRHGNRAEIDNLHLTDDEGNDLLRNGDFERGLAHWYFSSDRWHMPFHAKNLAVHLLFEQGLLGLLAFALATGAALWRTSLGAARRHPLAPLLAGAIAGALTVGAVDSLLDMPRVAFLLLLLIALALSLPRVSPGLKGPQAP